MTSTGRIDPVAVGRLVVDLQDEAERQRAELARSEQRLRSIYQGIACGIVVRDADGTIVHVNSVAEEILGIPAIDLLGYRSIGSHPAYSERGSVLGTADWPDLVALRTGRPERNVTLGIDQPAGARRWLQASAIPLPGPGDRPAEVVLSFVDVTARKNAEQQLCSLAQTEKLRAIGQMAGGIAHDVNQYLGLITGHGDLALRSLEPVNSDLEPLRQSIQTIIQAATDGAANVRRLLAFARPPGRATVRRANLGRLLADVADLTAPRWRDAVQAEGQLVALDITVEGDTSVDGSPEALREALANLVFNAVDAMPRGGTIHLA
ncbi:MAG: PAS domain S-box protein, partial [Chloroflexota bacterium]